MWLSLNLEVQLCITDKNNSLYNCVSTIKAGSDQLHTAQYWVASKDVLMVLRQAA